MLPGIFQRAVVLDFEASCLPGAGSFPIEIGLAFVSSGRTISIPIRPAEKWLASWTWDPASEAVHGWTIEQLLTVCAHTHDAFDQLCDLTRGCALYSDNPAAEAAWLEKLRDAASPLAECPTINLVDELSTAALRHAQPPDFFRAYRDAEQAAWLAYPREHRADQDAGRHAHLIRHILGLVR